MRLHSFAQPANGKDIGTQETTGIAVSTSSWETQDLTNIRIRFKLPPGYKQKQWEVSIGSGPLATFQLGHLNHIEFTVENVEDAKPEGAKIIRQRDYLDYKEWNQSISGHEIFVQAYQGGGSVTDEHGERLPFCVEVTCALDGKHLLRLSALLGDQKRQHEVLAMLKTIEFY
jgi:hypothetical protein